MIKSKGGHIYHLPISINNFYWGVACREITAGCQGRNVMEEVTKIYYNQFSALFLFVYYLFIFLGPKLIRSWHINNSLKRHSQTKWILKNASTIA